MPPMKRKPKAAPGSVSRGPKQLPTEMPPMKRRPKAAKVAPGGASQESGQPPAAPKIQRREKQKAKHRINMGKLILHHRPPKLRRSLWIKRTSCRLQNSPKS